MHANDNKLISELVSDPRMWRLSLELSETGLDVVMRSLVDDNGLIYQRFDFKADSGSLLDQFKLACGYTNDPNQQSMPSTSPLLADFGKTDVLLSTRRFMLVPDALATDDLRSDVMEVLWHDSDYSVVENKISVSGSTMLMSVDTPLLAFVHRTFPMARVMHRLTPFITYFYNIGRLNNTTQLIVNLGESQIDVLLLSNGQIIMVNTFEVRTLDDMYYFIMKAAESSSFDPMRDPLMLCGLTSVREKLMPGLRKYVKKVLPAQVSLPEVPQPIPNDAKRSLFELLILSRCE